MKRYPEKLEKLIDKTSFNCVSNAIPDEYLDAVKCVMGEMNLDSACEMSHWPDGRVFLNTYIWRNGSKLIPLLMEEIEAGRVTEAVVVANNQCTDADWYNPLFNGTMCFTNHENGHTNKGLCFVYFGPNQSKFVSEFDQFGNVVEKVKRRNPLINYNPTSFQLLSEAELSSLGFGVIHPIIHIF